MSRRRRWRAARCGPRPCFYCTAHTCRRIINSSRLSRGRAAEDERRVEGEEPIIVLNANVLLEKNLSVFLAVGDGERSAHRGRYATAACARPDGSPNLGAARGRASMIPPGV